jgi:glycosyltransferase involved in cell wall biosynthesis
MEKITFVLPSRNNLEFLKLAYTSIRNLNLIHEILILDDASVDGTQEWIKSLNDKDLITYHNSGPERIGIVGMFDKGIAMARTEIIFAFHADMVAAPDLDKHILKHLERGKVISATRVEPPLHPDGPEKVLKNFGIEAEDFDYNKFCEWVLKEHKPKHGVTTTEGIFAPWCMYKEDYLAIGGHDELFAPQSKEDSDLFNRFVLNDYKVIQTWEGLVYHFTSRGSRFNKHAGGAAGKNSDEWLYTTNKNARNFIRKWGHFVKHDPLMKPIVPPKYSVVFKITNCDSSHLSHLEPWCSVLYCDISQWGIDSYIRDEQPNTKIDLLKRVKPIDGVLSQGIIIEIDGKTFNWNQDFQYIQSISEIIQDSGEMGEFQLGNLYITINDLTNYEKELIKCV